MVKTQDFKKIDYVADVRRYDPKANEKAVEALRRHLGIALASRDAALVATSDPLERQRIVDGFLKKHLGLAGDDAALDRSVQEVGEQMKADQNKLRVTFYYLLAKKHGKLASLI